MKRKIFFVVLIIILLIVVGKNRQSDSEPITTTDTNLISGYHQTSIEVDGVTRYFQYLAPKEITGETSLLFVFHGRGTERRDDYANGTGMRKISNYGFEKDIDSHNYIVIYPEGINGAWNDGRTLNAEKTENSDDVKFVTDMINWFKKRANVGKVYASGFSNGAHLTYRLACQTDILSGASPVSAGLSDSLKSNCSNSLPIAIIFGQEDPISPYEGGEMDGGGTALSATETYNQFKNNNDCTNQATQNITSNVSVSSDTGCTSATSLYTIKDGGHTWPGGTQYLPKSLVGLANTEINASSEILKFFNLIE